MHPDAVIAIAASRNSRALTETIFGAEIGWLAWQRPGYDLGLKLSEFAHDHPSLKGVLLEAHGLFTWGDSSKACYKNTLRIVQEATDWLAENNTAPAFGGAAHQALPAAMRHATVAQLAPALRGKISATEYKVGHFDDSAPVLEFVCSKRLRELASLGTSCPDHFLRTKIRPLVLQFDPAQPDPDAALASLDQALNGYRENYAAYYNRCKRANSPAMRDPNPVVI
jgi:rhamnose utilization protein RhaD (predicted bifunctional aldolase and dehydrogenase)